MKRIGKFPAILAMLALVSIVMAACTPAATPTAAPTKAPAAASPAAAAPTQAATKPAASSPTAPAAALAPYKIGVVVALSGGFTGLGIPARDAAMAYANDVNAAGGINGRKLELVIYDDASDASTALLVIKKAINDDKVLGIVGPTGSGSAMAAIPVVQEAQIPMIVIASGDSIVNPVNKWVFKFVSGEIKNIPEQYAYLKSKGVKKLATMNPNNAVGKAGTAYIQPSYAKAGFELVTEQTYEPADTDFAAQLTKIKAAGAEGVIVYDATVTSALVARQMKAMGINVPWTGPYGIIGPANVQAAGEAFNGLVVPAPKVYVVNELADSDPQKKVAQQFYAAFKKSTGKDADPVGMHGWDGVMVLADARAKVRDAVEGLKNFPAVVSLLTLSPTDHEGMPPNWMALVQVNNGKFSIAK